MLLDKTVLDIPSDYYFKFATALNVAKVTCLNIGENDDLKFKRYLLSRNISKAIKMSKGNNNYALVNLMFLDLLSLRKKALIILDNSQNMIESDINDAALNPEKNITIGSIRKDAALNPKEKAKTFLDNSGNFKRRNLRKF